MKNKLNNLNALILIGGKSTRMKTDKSLLVYHNQTQQKFLFNLLKEIIPKYNIYYSVRDDKQLEGALTIPDYQPDLGPFGAIYSAFEFNKKKAWLILAIDIPFLTKNMLNVLIKNRDLSKIATTFQGKTKKYPEPLITIWEPKVIPLLKKKLTTHDLSLTKILKNNNTKIIQIDDFLIENVNTQGEYLEAKSFLKKQRSL